MRVALVNPTWTFAGSIYFGCREPHLPLEYGYSRALLERRGHEVRIVDGQARGLVPGAIRDEVLAFAPDVAVVTTAPSYLFWRCAPPELRAPLEALHAIHGAAALTIAVGPHPSTTPRAALCKLGVDVVVMGEPEEVLPELVETPREGWRAIASIAYENRGEVIVQGSPRASDMRALPALRWEATTIAAHTHHHHRFDASPDGPGAEIEASRGCPYHSSNEQDSRDRCRRRPLEVVLEELDGLIAEGARYVYFIDEIFLPDRPLLDALAVRPIKFGAQLRVDDWSPENLDRLGAAGCVSIEVGVASVTPEGRGLPDRKRSLSTADLEALLVHARSRVPFVQANLLGSANDDPALVARFRERLARRGVWANEPVPMFPYPGSPDYAQRFGPPDDEAWERALASYLGELDRFSDTQDDHPLPEGGPG